MRALAKAEINPTEGVRKTETISKTNVDEDEEEEEPTLAEKAQIAGHERAVQAVMKANQRNNNKNGEENNNNSNSAGGTKVKDRQLRLTSTSGGSKKGDKKRSKRKRRREAEEDQAIADLKKRMKEIQIMIFTAMVIVRINPRTYFRRQQNRETFLSQIWVASKRHYPQSMNFILRPLKHPELYDWLGVPPPQRCFAARTTRMW